MNGVDGSVETEPVFGERRLLVGTVDVCLLVALVLVGQLDHGINPLADPLAAVETMIPFVVGWLIVGTLAGAYRPTAFETLTRGAVVTAVGWLGGANIGFILRSSPLFEGGALWPFNLVMTALGLLVLVGWRVGYVYFSSGR